MLNVEFKTSSKSPINCRVRFYLFPRSFKAQNVGYFQMQYWNSERNSTNDSINHSKWIR